MTDQKKDLEIKTNPPTTPSYEYETLISWQPKMYSKIEQTLVVDGTAERSAINKQSIREAQNLFYFADGLAEKPIQPQMGNEAAPPVDSEGQQTLDKEEPPLGEPDKHDAKTCPVCKDAGRRVLYVDGERTIVIDKTGKEGREVRAYRHPEETGVYDATSQRTGNPFKAFWSCELSREIMPGSDKPYCRWTQHAKIDTEWP